MLLPASVPLLKSVLPFHPTPLLPVYTPLIPENLKQTVVLYKSFPNSLLGIDISFSMSAEHPVYNSLKACTIIYFIFQFLCYTSLSSSMLPVT